jgi:class 3 adenylate cyclase
LAPRFPKEKESEVTAAINEHLEKNDVRIGVASATCGGDIIFLEQVVKRGGEIHIVLPYPMPRFEADALARDKFQFNAQLDGRPKGTWTSRFWNVWEQATTTTILSQHSALDNAMISECCNRTSLGLALLKGESLAARVQLFALWDRLPGDKFGGTHSMIQYAGKWLPEGDIIYLDVLIPQEPKPKTQQTADPSQQICALLFADVAAFSKINEKELRNYREFYLVRLAQLIQTRRPQPLLEFNTWGDGLFCVFQDMESAGRFALDMQEMVNKKKPTAYGLPEGFGIRVSLHAGPVYRIDDPVLGRGNYIGTHVNLGARIETKTPVGCIYCSQVFAAMAAAEGANGFACEYVDEIPLPKLDVPQPVYVLRRKATST